MIRWIEYLERPGKNDTDDVVYVNSAICINQDSLLTKARLDVSLRDLVIQCRSLKYDTDNAVV